MQGEAAKAGNVKPRGAGHIIKQLGLFGLYKGSAAWFVHSLKSSRLRPLLTFFWFDSLLRGSSLSVRLTYRKVTATDDRGCFSRRSVQCYLLHFVFASKDGFL
jgi:hypothetical protein